jgi:hypothetical protein
MTRADIEDIIQMLIDALDAIDARTADMEPDADGEEGGDLEAESLREWFPREVKFIRGSAPALRHRKGATPPARRSGSGERSINPDA